MKEEKQEKDYKNYEKELLENPSLKKGGLKNCENCGMLFQDTSGDRTSCWECTL